MAPPRVEVVHVGSACRDIAPEDPRGWRLGGGVTYASLTTARLGLRTAAIVGVDATAATASELDLLRDAGVDLLLVPLAEGPIFHNVETPTGRVQTSVATGMPLPIPAIPESWLAAPGWSLVPVAARGHRRLGRRHPRRRPSRRGVAGVPPPSSSRASGSSAGRPEPSAILRRADLVGRQPSRRAARDAPGRALRRCSTRARTCSSRRAARAACWSTSASDGPTETLRYLPTRTAGETDPTGAGDTFLAALQASVLRPAVAGRRRSRHGLDLRFAAAAGSLVVGGPRAGRRAGSDGRARPARARADPPRGRARGGQPGRASVDAP